MLSKQCQGRQQAFTLIEVLIAIVVVAVIMTIAMPAYQGAVIKTNRAAAQAYLLLLAQKQQLFFNQSRRYALDETELGLKSPANVSSHYDISFDLDPNSILSEGFLLSASPLSSSWQSRDGKLSLDHTGASLRDTNSGVEPW